MDYEDLITEYGTCAAAARELGYYRQTVHKWKTSRRGIPFEDQFRIQMKTKGRLKATLPSEKKAA